MIVVCVKRSSDQVGRPSRLIAMRCITCKCKKNFLVVNLEYSNVNGVDFAGIPVITFFVKNAHLKFRHVRTKPIYIKKMWYDCLDETTSMYPKRDQNGTYINSYRSPYGLQQ